MNSTSTGTRAVLDVLDTAMGSRRQPSCGSSPPPATIHPESVYAQEHTYARNMIQQAFVDDEWFVYIATLDPEDRWDDPKVWIKANPNWRFQVKPDDMQRQARAAKHNPAKLMEFKRLRLNMRTASATQLSPARSGTPIRPAPSIRDALRGRRCFAGPRSGDEDRPRGLREAVPTRGPR